MDGQCRPACTASSKTGILPVMHMLAVVLLLVMGLPVAADPAPHGELAETNDAIGRLNHAGYRRKRHCTMFAVSPRVAVTAAHCLDGLDATRTHLLFGYSRMEWTAHLSPTKAVVLANDVAVLCLAQDAPATIVQSRRRNYTVGSPFSVVGYGMPVHQAQSRTACTLKGNADRYSLTSHSKNPGPFVLRGTPELGAAMMLDCPQSGGASGGPLLDAAGAVVGVISSTSRTKLLVSVLPPNVAGACVGR